MDEKKMKRAGIVAIAVPALTVGTVALVSAYRADNDFQPFNTDRELQKNQVVFSDDEEAAGEQEQQQGEESEYWKKIQIPQRTRVLFRDHRMENICLRTVFSTRAIRPIILRGLEIPPQVVYKARPVREVDSRSTI